MRKEIIKTLVDLCMEINGLSPRVAEGKGGSPTAFFSFAGHVGKFCIEVFLGGWKKEKLAADMKWELCTDSAGFDIREYEDAYDSLLALRDGMWERPDGAREALCAKGMALAHEKIREGLRGRGWVNILTNEFVPEEEAFEYAMKDCLEAVPEFMRELKWTREFKEMLVEWHYSGNWIREE